MEWKVNGRWNKDRKRKYVIEMSRKILRTGLETNEIY